MSTANRTLVCLGLLLTMGAIVLVEGKEIRSSGVAVQAAPMAKAKGAMDASGVMYFSSEEITPAFKANLMMYDGKGGEVEIHKKDTDVFYILEGEATFVTGGTVTGGTETAPDEVRIATMEGGVTRKIEKGDVIVVPANVTHWFKEVEKPVTYFGVKVR